MFTLSFHNLLSLSQYDASVSATFALIHTRTHSNVWILQINTLTPLNLGWDFGFNVLNGCSSLFFLFAFVYVTSLFKWIGVLFIFFILNSNWLHLSFYMNVCMLLDLSHNLIVDVIACDCIDDAQLVVGH